MRRQQVRLVVILGAFSIIGIISVQTYFLVKAWSIREKQLNQSIVIALKSVAEKMSRLNQSLLPIGNPVRQLNSNYFVVDVNSEIDANVLEHYLKIEFERLNIRTDYQYAIYDCHSDSMVYGDYIPVPGSEAVKEPTELPKYRGYLYYFGIHFPALRSTIAGDMTVLFFFTAILLFSVIFFAYALFVILQQKRYSELQKDFINNMTHEFKTPISSIGISAEIITDPGIVNDPQRLATYGNIIRKENRRLNLLVEKVLQVARFEKGGVMLKKEWLELNLLLSTVVENFKAAVRSGITISLSTDDRIGKVEADVIHLTNIIHNLLDNSVKYAGETPVISIATQLESGRILLVFSDNGPGIDPKYHKSIFRKFFRVPSGNVHDVKGFGLGLYYVKTVCQAHRWLVYLDRKAMQGATFVIQIPLKS